MCFSPVLCPPPKNGATGREVWPGTQWGAEETVLPCQAGESRVQGAVPRQGLGNPDGGAEGRVRLVSLAMDLTQQSPRSLL